MKAAHVSPVVKAAWPAVLLPVVPVPDLELVRKAVLAAASAAVPLVVPVQVSDLELVRRAPSAVVSAVLLPRVICVPERFSRKMLLLIQIPIRVQMQRKNPHLR